MILNELHKTISKTVDLDYLTAYTGSTKNKPCIVFLHGAGERGDVNKAMSSSCWHGMRKKYKEKFVVLTPSCKSYEIWEPDSIIAMIHIAQRDLGIDPKGIFLTGYSMGGRGTWNIATSYPDMFAGIIPISGYSYYLKAPKIVNIPTWAFHGNKDTVVPIAESVKMISEMKRFGGNPLFSTMNCSHGGWDIIYSSDEIYDWMLSIYEQNI